MIKKAIVGNYDSYSSTSKAIIIQVLEATKAVALTGKIILSDTVIIKT